MPGDGRALTAGDTPLDLQARTNAGACYVVGVFTGGVSQDVLSAEPHTHIVDSAAQIAEMAGAGFEPAKD